ncbi:hypothetical protein VTL71DRAFT_7813 [Oculimacula yallundae]|uniref:Uncharacterized protein n=1 Tax=Oculimacula yallundae TaxID=86028 RepID=A0ABR4CVZ3_9HELO
MLKQEHGNLLCTALLFLSDTTENNYSSPKGTNTEPNAVVVHPSRSFVIHNTSRCMYLYRMQNAIMPQKSECPTFPSDAPWHLNPEDNSTRSSMFRRTNLSPN